MTAQPDAPQSTGPTWREQYHAEMAALVLRDGTPVRHDASRLNRGAMSVAEWGWEDHDTAQHFLPANQRMPFERIRAANPNPQACTPVAPAGARVVEHHVDQWEGTGLGEEVALVLLSDVSCACGAHAGLVWAVQSTVGELTLALLNGDAIQAP